MPLSITRKPGESFFIGKDSEIEIVVLKSSGSSVVLSIKAPKDVPVIREELEFKAWLDKPDDLIASGQSALQRSID